ncbi:MAG: hypothetical protein J1E62_10960 [Lachnospiraceae bacterium]|nr:hypothetical protein [Lachnospiraceae bacterium]
MGCLYLHIGTPKTGTTSIQFFLNKNKNVFLEKGYAIPDPGYRFDKVHKNRNGHFLVQQYYDENKKRLREEEDQLRSEGVEKVLECLKEHDNVILSDESIYIHSHKIKNFWPNLVQAMTEKNHTLKVIVYIRRQDSYIRSFWTQSVKAMSQQKEFAEYIETDATERLRADYSKELDKIASFVGQENLIVRPFERGQLMNEDLYTDFLDCLDLAMTEEFNCADQVKNDTVAGDYIKAKQILNARPEFSERKGFLLHVIQNATAHREEKADYRRAAMFPDNDPAQYLERFREGNESVARKYLNREDGILFRESTKSEKELEPYSTDELVLACGDMILELKRELDQIKADKQSLKLQLKVLKKMIKRRVRFFKKKS